MKHLRRLGRGLFFLGVWAIIFGIITGIVFAILAHPHSLYFFAVVLFLSLAYLLGIE